ncbi:DUF3343 domain-containing protein [uncultured Senegalimassilia sp.]|uniref:DUF3343 domain-containing protein n=1 Tax=uncultured Senegalimassilia sp. TaxID=1714350 RepID=UPI0025F7A006|nr:DUF3343 domain-containing protein [uncultured Senegalimassilia sp.]
MQRCKTPHAVVTFHSTADAMAVQAAAGDGLPGRVIPVPSEISAGCGLAWSVPAEHRETLEQALAQRGLAFEAITVVELY